MKKVYYFLSLGLTLLLLLSFSGINAQVDYVESNSTQCYADDDGSIIVHLLPGVSVSGLTVNGTSETLVQAGPNLYIYDLVAGSYNLVISFASQPDYLITIDVDEPDPLYYDLNFDYDCGGSQVLQICAVDITGGTYPGGTAPYDFYWLDFANFQQLPVFFDILGLPCIDASSHPAFMPIDMTTYSGDVELYVFDDNDCFFSQTITLNPPTITFDIVASDAICVPANSGGLEVTNVAGGVAPYTYTWSTGDVTTVGVLADLLPGIYTVTVTDSYGCMSAEMSAEVINPNLISMTYTSSDVSCYGGNDGSITATIVGGSGQFFFNWSNGLIGLGENVAAGLYAGIHTVEATDVTTNCNVSETIEILEPTPLTIGGQIEHVSCNALCDGSVEAIATGGTPPYTYSLISGGIPTTPQTGSEFVGLCSGIYSIEVMDANQCVSLYPDFEILQPEMLTVTVNTNDVSCYGVGDGDIELVVVGGTAPYVFSWDNGAITSTLDMLGPGTYYYTVTDLNACSYSDMVMINEPAVLGDTYTSSDISCYGAGDGMIDVTVTGGTMPYAYAWDMGGVAFSTDEDLTGLEIGVYCLVVTDANGCVVADVCEEITEPTALTISGQVEHVTCYDYCDGSVEAFATGGTMPYEYRVFDGTNYTAWQTGSVFSNLCNGFYSLEVMDANGCISEYPNFEITQPAPFLISAAVQNDISCYMAADGAIDITIVGGAIPYNIMWNNQETTEDLSGLMPGTYCVTIADVNLCEVEECYTLTEPMMLSASWTYTDVTCNGANNGSVTVDVVGGTAPFTYEWTLGALTVSTDQSLVNVGPGNYCLVVTDANGCLFSFCQEVYEPGPLTILGQVEHISCNGANDGQVEAQATGGTPTYEYRLYTNASGLYTAWQTGSLFTGLAAGFYSLEVIDYNGCISVYPDFEILEPTPLTISNSVVIDVDCYGNANGSIDLTIVGGTTPYIVEWNNGPAGATSLSALVPGQYCVTITDLNGCVETGCYDIFEPDVLSTAWTYTDITCNGANDGSITLDIIGGTTPYAYEWTLGGSVFSTDGSLTAIAPGNYCLVVTDANGCTYSFCQEILEPGPLTILGQVEHISCFGANDGQVEAQATGGTPNSIASAGWEYQYRLYSNAGGTYTAWQNGSLFDGLAPGFYSLEVIDANGCISVYPDFEILEPAPLTISNAVVTDVDCYGNANGTIDLIIVGGTTPYIIEWNNGPAGAISLSGLVPGQYCITITDLNGCVETGCYDILEPTSLLASWNATDITCNGANDGSIAVDVSGGLSPFTYEWTLGGTFFSADAGLTAIGPGNYCLVVTDANGCTFSFCEEILEPAPLTILGQIEHISCYGANDGQVEAQATGGTPGTVASAGWEYQYRLYSNASGTYTAWQNGSLFSGLMPGFYSLEVIDYNGCISVYPDFEIIEPPFLDISVVATDLMCLNGDQGAVDLTIVGGMPPYFIAWSNGEGTEDISNLEAGEYCVTVTDSYGCVATVCADVNQPANPLAALYITGENVSCFGLDNGWFEVMAEGGAAPYQYSLDYGAYTAFMTTPMIYDNLTPGFHLLTIGDSNNCEILYEIEITEPEGMLLTSVIVNIDCNGNSNGSIDLTVSGGVTSLPPAGGMGYDIIWSNGATTEDLVNIVAGMYTVTITDQNGCEVIETFEVTEPAAIILDYTSQSLNCYGEGSGWIDLSVTGGAAPYYYTWNNGAMTEDLADLSGGFYVVTVTDGNQCIAITSVLITEPAPTVLDFNVTDIQCTGMNDGAIDLLWTGGTSSCVTFLWSNGANTEDLSGLAPGWYWVTVTDCNGCMSIDSACVYSPNTQLEVGYVVSNVLCNGGSTGSIEINAIGGTMPYAGVQFEGMGVVINDAWALGQTSTMFDNLVAGVYGVTLTDAYGCEVITEITVGEPTCPLNISNYTITDIDLGTPGAIDVYVCCGTFPYTYYWEYEGYFYSTSEDIIDGPSGEYTLVVTDANGCTVSGAFVIDSNTYPDWTNGISESSHTIYIPEMAVTALSIGDYIGVFYDSLGTFTCGGLIKWEGTATTLAAWGDDGIDPSNETGFVDGEEFTWVIWDAATATEFIATPVYDLMFPNTNTYTVNGISGLTSLTTGTVLDMQDVVLNAGWSLMSTYIIPFYADAEDVFAPVLSDLIIVKNGFGQVYWPSVPVDMIGDIVIGEGYKVKMAAANTLTIEGVQVVPELTDVVIPAEWSILGYLRTSPAAIDVLLGGVVADIVIVKNEEGNVYWPPMFGLNTIGNMLPGKGYMIKMTQSATLTYPANGSLAQSTKSGIETEAMYFGNDINTGANMTVGIPSNAWTSAPKIGDEVAVYNSNGDLVGASAYNGNAMSITIWGDDELSASVDGMVSGGQFTFTLWHQATNESEVLVVNEWLSGDDLYSDNAISVVGKFAASQIAGLNYNLYQNMPNPFNNTTQIKFDLPTDTYVHLGVYNLLGELVEEVVGQDLQAGEHTYEFSAAHLPAGTYMYKIVTDNYAAVKNMNVIK